MRKLIHPINLALLLLLTLSACGGAESEPAAESAPADSAAESEPAAPAPEGVDVFTVDTAASSASYIVDEEFLGDALEKLGIAAGDVVVVGTTPGVSGEIQLDLDAADPFVAAQFTVDMTGLETDQNRRDNWLRDNAIQTSAFPEATFVANGASGLPETIPTGEEIAFQLNGDLTIRDATNSVTFDVVATLVDAETITGTAVLDLNMSDFGITPPDFANTLTVADLFRIEVDLTATQ
jgi:polyisoprenoid-binding protein YceI